jgi:hypothetical protein
MMHGLWSLILSLSVVLAGISVKDVNGHAQHPFDLHDQKAVVLIFVGTECPISNSYSPEINRIVADYSRRGFDFYMVYSDPTVSAADAKKHAEAFGYKCPALLDQQQVLKKLAGATATPQAVVMTAAGDTLYSGRIDNWYEDFGKQRYSATVHDLRDALEAIAVGKKVAVRVTKVVGCPI